MGLDEEPRGWPSLSKGRAFLSDQRLVLLVHSTLPLLEELPMPRPAKRKAENLKFPHKTKIKKTTDANGQFAQGRQPTQQRRAEASERSERRAERSDEQHASILRTDEGPKEPPPGLAINFR